MGYDLKKKEVPVPRGIYREGEWARVEYESKPALSIPRDLYDERGLLPLFSQLPTKSEYERQNPKQQR